MVFLIFGHTAEDPPLRIGPLPSEHDDAWHLHRSQATCSAVVVTPQQLI